MWIMKTTLITFLALIAIQASEEGQITKRKRYSQQLGEPIDLGWTSSSFDEIYAPGIDKYLPIQTLNTPDYGFKFHLESAPHPTNHQIFSTNSIEKPVQEDQEIVPPQTVNPAILPNIPQPATPVNAAAANVPSNQGAVFLGSGSLGVVSLGNGAYALGSGSLGYSGNRAQPRPGGNVPVYPPLAASPDLIPAAVPSPSPLPQIPTNNFDFNHPLFNRKPLDANGYEFLPPNQVGFGMPNPRPPMVRIRQQFATPSALQLQPQYPQFQAVPQVQKPRRNQQFANIGGYEYTIPFGRRTPNY